MKVFISDFDGVLVDSGDAFAKQWSEILKVSITPTDIPNWNFELALGISPNLLDEFWDKVWVEQDLKPYPGALAFVDRVKYLGYKFVVLTSRWNPKAISALFKSLRYFNATPSLNCEPDDILLCGKDAKKSTFINDSGTDQPLFFLDDHVKNCVDVKIHCPTLREVMLFSRPWNQSADICGYLRVKSYGDVLTRLSKEAA